MAKDKTKMRIGQSYRFIYKLQESALNQILMSFGIYLRQLRLRKKVNQSRIASLVGKEHPKSTICSRDIAKLERGKTLDSFQTDKSSVRLRKYLLWYFTYLGMNDDEIKYWPRLLWSIYCWKEGDW